MTMLASFTPSQAVRRITAGSLRAPQSASSADVISLAMGEPGFETPPAIRLVAHAAIECGYTHYAHPQGDPELREALADQLSTGAEAQYGPKDVLLTHGGTGGLAAAVLALVDPGDTVVLPDPTYSLYADLIHLAGGRCLRVPLASDLHWDLDALTAALATAKLFVFCNPSNPTGIVHSDHELQVLSEAVAASGMLVTFSKAYAMTGWRLGYLAGPTDIIAAATRVHSGLAAIDGLTLAPPGRVLRLPRYAHAVPATDLVAHLRRRGVAVRPGSSLNTLQELQR